MVWGALAIFFSKIYVSLERSPLEGAKKKHQTIEKVEILMPTVNSLFKKIIIYT